MVVMVGDQRVDGGEVVRWSWWKIAGVTRTLILCSPAESGRGVVALSLSDR